ncbi:hypothetical protein D3C80_1915340 [compost metagenome]
MLVDPFEGQGLDALLFALAFLLPVVTFDLADLFAHPRLEQGLLVDEGDPHQIAMLSSQAPGHIAQVADIFTQGRHSHFQCRSLAPGAVVIASHASETDRVQLLPRNTLVFAQR